MKIDAQLGPAPTAHAGSSPMARAAREFEAQLLASFLDVSGTGLLGLPGAQSAAAESYASLAREMLASAVSAAGGLGLARLLTRTLEGTKVPNPPGLLPVSPKPAAYLHDFNGLSKPGFQLFPSEGTD